MKILSICGSPRRGNSETILLYLKKLLEKQGHINEIILLREQNIERCHGCVEFCNHQLQCRLHDDFDTLIPKIESVDAFIFACPNYFQMPPGIFKDFIDRFSIFYTRGDEKRFKNKKAIVVCVGADSPDKTDVCTDNIAINFCRTGGLNVVGKKSFQSKSELVGNLNDIFENNLNPNIHQDLQNLVDILTKN